MFDVVFINSTADFQKLLHNVSSLVGSNESLAFEISMVTYYLYIFVLLSYWLPCLMVKQRKLK